MAEGGQWRVGEAVEGAAGQGEAVWMVQEEEGVGKKVQLRSQALQTPIRESELGMKMLKNALKITIIFT